MVLFAATNLVKKIVQEHGTRRVVLVTSVTKQIRASISPIIPVKSINERGDRFSNQKNSSRTSKHTASSRCFLFKDSGMEGTTLVFGAMSDQREIDFPRRKITTAWSLISHRNNRFKLCHACARGIPDCLSLNIYCKKAFGGFLFGPTHKKRSY